MDFYCDWRRFLLWLAGNCYQRRRRVSTARWRTSAGCWRAGGTRAVGERITSDRPKFGPANRRLSSPYINYGPSDFPRNENGPTEDTALLPSPPRWRLMRSFCLLALTSQLTWAGPFSRIDPFLRSLDKQKTRSFDSIDALIVQFSWPLNFWPLCSWPCWLFFKKSSILKKNSSIWKSSSILKKVHQILEKVHEIWKKNHEFEEKFTKLKKVQDLGKFIILKKIAKIK